MPDRADHLARNLITRLSNLHRRFLEEKRGEPDRSQRIEVVAKVLAVEFGVTDGATLSSVEAAAPTVLPGQPAHARDTAEFADFLRQRLAIHLAET
jgi:hypothetical protein